MAGFPLQNLVINLNAGASGNGGAFDVTQFANVSVAGYVDNYVPNGNALRISLQIQLEDGTFETVQTIALVSTGSANITEQVFSTPVSAARITWDGTPGPVTGTFEVSVWGEE